MKSLLHTLLALAMSGTAFAAAEKPALPIEKALSIAQDYLKKQGRAGSIAIGGLSTERVAFNDKRMRWYAKWVPTIALEGGRQEFGIEIEMDGNVARIVDKKAPKN